MTFDEGKMFNFSFKFETFELKVSLPAISKKAALEILRKNFATHINEINEELIKEK